MNGFRVGALELFTVRDGLFKLDGGAMFGIVPRPAWERVAPPDERNRISLSLNPLLIRTGSKNILVDTGIGSKYDEKWKDLYAIDHEWSVPSGLRALGLSPGDIDVVIPSHLHFDHMGGATAMEGGKPVPVFPNATFVVQEKEWNAAHDSNPRLRGSYLEPDFEPIQAAGNLKRIDGDEEVAPGVRIELTGGHSHGHQVVHVESKGIHGVYLGDLMPTVGHLKPAWCMGYDVFPAEVARLKETFLNRAADEGWILIFDHDTEVAMARVERQGPKFKVIPVRGI